MFISTVHVFCFQFPYIDVMPASIYLFAPYRIHRQSPFQCKIFLLRIPTDTYSPPPEPTNSPSPPTKKPSRPKTSSKPSPNANTKTSSPASKPNSTGSTKSPRASGTNTGAKSRKRKRAARMRMVAVRSEIVPSTGIWGTVGRMIGWAMMMMRGRSERGRGSGGKKERPRGWERKRMGQACRER